jgi:hypothetical protein
MAASTATVVNIDPKAILVESNIRYGLKRSRLDSLKADILNYGGIHTPGEVEPLSPPQNGLKYRLTVGAYRLSAITELNAQDGAGLLFPAIVKNVGNAVDRIKRQLSENLERESMSPLDTAVAIQKLLAEGVSKGEIRTLFARPGGKKGTEIVPASNAWVNMTLSFLDLPKAIQEKIHLGLVGIAAAYELTKVSPEKREDVLKRAEAERLKAEESEGKMEEKLLKDEKRAAEMQAKVDAKAMTLQVTKDELAIAEVQLKEKLAASAEAYQANQALLKDAPAETKKASEEKWLALEADVKGLKTLVATKKGVVAKLEGAVSSGSTKAEELKKKLENARKAKGKGKAGPTSRDVKQAAKAEGDGNHVALTIAEVRQAIAAMSRSSFPTVKRIGKELTACFDGVTTDKMLIDAIAILVGDKQAPKVKPAK